MSRQDFLIVLAAVALTVTGIFSGICWQSVFLATHAPLRAQQTTRRVMILKQPPPNRLPTIPYAREVYEEGRTLHVVTDLMHESDSPGFERAMHDEMMWSIAQVTGTDDYREPRWLNYVNHSPDSPKYR